MKHKELFSDFELKFLNSMKRWTRVLTQKQRDLLAALLERLEELTTDEEVA